LKDIQAVLGTDAYAKLRFGIGDQFPKGMQADFVLSKWKPEEIDTIKGKIAGSVEVIENFAAIGLDRTMSLFNQKTY
jgi:peptidyl-tRNA hydrolase, PTH1 family